MQVEADVCDGMPVFEMVGELSTEVRESKERIRAAIRNTGIRLEPKRITVNLYPADLRKSGTGFDLPIALAVLAAYGHISASYLEETVFAGEVSLNGSIHSIEGVLPMAIAAREAGKKRICIPQANIKEAALVKDIAILPAKSLGQVLEMLQNAGTSKAFYNGSNNIEETELKQVEKEYDFKKIRGQKVLKRVCEIAAAGRHNLLMLGPPGSGKTAAARAIPKIYLRIFRLTCPSNVLFGLFIIPVYSNSYPKRRSWRSLLRQSSLTLTKSCRKTFLPRNSSMSSRAVCPTRLSFSPLWPIRMPFCESRAT